MHQRRQEVRLCLEGFRIGTESRFVSAMCFKLYAGTGVCEYLVQRHGDWYLSCYLAMAVTCYFMARLPYAMYRSVCAKKKRAKKNA